MRTGKITALMTSFLFLISAGKLYASLYGLNGDTIEVSRQIPSMGFTYGPFIYTVGPSDTIALSGGNNSYLTVNDTSLQFSFGPNAGSGGPFQPSQHFVLFQDLSPTAPAIIGVSYTTDLPGFVASDLSFTAHTVTVDEGGLNWPGGQYLDVNLQFVPEPSSFALFGIGIVMILSRKLIARRLAVFF